MIEPIVDWTDLSLNLGSEKGPQYRFSSGSVNQNQHDNEFDGANEAKMVVVLNADDDIWAPFPGPMLGRTPGTPMCPTQAHLFSSLSMINGSNFTNVQQKDGMGWEHSILI